MKKLLLLLVTLTLGLMVGYSYDDSAILDKIAEMEKEHDEMQAQIDAQQTLLDALANKLTITNIVQNTNGYTISFSDGTTATINNGKDGDKGEDGEDGDSFFAEVVVGTTDVTFTPADGTVVVIPLGSGSGSGNTSAEGNKIYYTTSDGKKLLPYNTKPAAFGAILVSNTYEEGQGVLIFDDTITSIGNEAFRDCTSLTSVTIPDGVTEIGEYAFSGCTSLNSITIPDSVTKIGGSAFSGCDSLTDTYVNITDLAAYATGNRTYRFPGAKHLMINGTEITELVIPFKEVEMIGDVAFDDCSSLTSITIPDSVTSIGDYAFRGCSSLTSVHITDVAAWCGITFVNYSANPLYYAHNLYLNGELVTDLVIPDSVTTIGKYAFSNCKSLTSITIPEGVTEIGDNAFDDCSSLTSITIPDSVVSIGVQAFYCRSLKSFYGKFASDDNRCLVVDGVLKSFAPAELTAYTIPDSVTEIGEYAFYYCSSLTSVTIPDSVTSIGNYAFSGCI